MVLQMERHLRGANVFAGFILFPLLGGAKRGSDKERGATDATSAFYSSGLMTAVIGGRGDGP